MWLVGESGKITEAEKTGRISLINTKDINDSWFGYLYPNEEEQDFFYLVWDRPLKISPKMYKI